MSDSANLKCGPCDGTGWTRGERCFCNGRCTRCLAVHEGDCQPPQTPDVPCLWCGKTATKLCDYWLGCVPVDGLISATTEQFLCDAPMCSDHANLCGHMCADDGCDTVDRCPAHVEDDASHQPEYWETAPKDAVHAERVRRDIRVQARRSQLHSVPLDS